MENSIHGKLISVDIQILEFYCLITLWPLFFNGYFCHFIPVWLNSVPETSWVKTVTEDDVYRNATNSSQFELNSSCMWLFSNCTANYEYNKKCKDSLQVCSVFDVNIKDCLLETSHFSCVSVDTKCLYWQEGALNIRHNLQQFMLCFTLE